MFVEQGFKFPGSYINDLAVADVDGNGIDDLLMPDLEKQQLIVLLGRVGGNFECRLFPIQWPASVVVGDFNNDKRPDAVIAVQPYAAAGGPDRLFMLTNTGQW